MSKLWRRKLSMREGERSLLEGCDLGREMVLDCKGRG